MNLLRAYGRAYILFFQITLSWVMDMAPEAKDKKTGRSIGFSLLALILWFVFLCAGLIIGRTISSTDTVRIIDTLMVIVWGFVITPALVAGFMRVTFPRFIHELDMQKKVSTEAQYTSSEPQKTEPMQENEVPDQTEIHS